MTPKQLVKLYGAHGSLKGAARASGETWNHVHNVYVRAVAEGLMNPLRLGRKSRLDFAETKSAPVLRAGRVRALKTSKAPLPGRGKVRRYLFTCAQNNTRLHTSLWANLKALAAHREAEIHVSRFTYIKSGLGAVGDKARVMRKEVLHGGRDVWWDPAIEPHLSDYRLLVAPGLVWCGEMNTLPTATRPLSGLEVYTGRKSGIFPHVKLAMQSIPSAKREPTKFNYTTGTVTQRNYIQRKAGLKAEFHHTYGALLVEVDGDGNWFVRQVNADSEGTIHDLDLRVKGGKVEVGHWVEAITWGDVHVAQIDRDVLHAQWGPQGICDVLRPRQQFLHDVLDFRSQSHHEAKDPHVKFKRYVQGESDVAAEVRGVAEFLPAVLRPKCRTHVVDSNHHHHLGRWLREQDGRLDPQNAQFWIEMQGRVYAEIAGGREPCYLRLALEAVGFKWDPKSLVFLGEDDSVIVCPDANGGIECGVHGDVGPGGSRGSTASYTRMGRKMNKGHDHMAAIMDGVYSAGTSSVLDPDWTRGPNAWSHSLTVTYDNGKRTIVTIWNKKWRAT